MTTVDRARCEPEAAARTASWPLGTVAFLAAVGVPAAFFVLDGPAAGVPTGIMPVSFVLLVWASLHLSQQVATGAPAVTRLTVWMFIYISGAVVPLAQAHSALYPWVMDVRLVLSAQIIVLLFCAGVEVGSFLGRRQASKPHDISYARVDDRALWVLTVAALVASAVYVTKLGGPATFFQSRWALAGAFDAAGLRGGSQVGSALWNTLGTIPVLVVWITWTVKLARNPDQRKFDACCVWVALAAANVVVNNPISNARYWFLAVLAGMVFAWPRISARTIRWTIIGGVIVALVVFPYADYFRTGLKTGAPVIESVEQKISTKDYDQSVMTANGVWWVNAKEHTLGRQVAGAALFWVPRSVWPGKPLDTGVLIGRDMDTGNNNLSSPLWLELWVDFGWAGALLAGLAAGALTRRLDDRFVASRDPLRRQVIAHDVFVPVFAGYAFILLRGPLLQSMSRLSVILAVALLLARSPGPRRNT